MRWDEVAAIGKELPEVEEGVWYRTPSLKVRGRSFCRLKENGRDIVFLTGTVDQQEHLIEHNPALYYITDHYRGWPAVLARLAKLKPAECRVRLEFGWRLKAPKTLAKQFDAVSSAVCGGGPASAARDGGGKPTQSRGKAARQLPRKRGSKRA